MRERTDLHLTLSNGPEATGEVRAAVGAFCERYRVHEEDCFDLKLAATEAVTNALKGTRDPHAVEVTLSGGGDVIEIEIVDRGVFSPVRAALARGPDAEGGRGIALMLALVDDLAFERTSLGTRVRMRKYRRPARPHLRLAG